MFNYNYINELIDKIKELTLENIELRNRYDGLLERYMVLEDKKIELEDEIDKLKER